MSQERTVIDLDQLGQHLGGCSEEASCGSTRRAFCIGTGIGLLGLAAGCGAEDPRIDTGGIDNLPGNLPDPGSPDMAHGGGTNGGTTNGGTTNGGTTTGGTTTGGTTSGGTTGGGTTGGGTTGSPPGMCASSLVSAGAASAVAVGKAVRIRSGNLDAWLCHDSAGYYALDNWCPHRGCTVSFRTQGDFYCGCHGATFDFTGARTNTKSPKPMNHLLMCIDTAGDAFIDASQTVTATTRV